MASVLVVDDEPAVRQLVAEILRLEGHDVREARNGRHALDLITGPPARVPDLIVLDLAMPEMDGWHFLEELYVRGIREQTRVIVITGAYDTEQPPQTGPAVPVLHKPFDAETLVAHVDEALRRDAKQLYEDRERSGQLARLLARVDQVLRDDT